jgi:LmbE family N-acetylglucosaminyl deacetylase
MRKVALSFLAHPDDAEFSCTGTMLRLKDLGWEIHIATVTAGDAGSITQDRWATAATRTAEARSAAELVPASYHCLGEPDGFVVYSKPAIRKSIDLLRRIAPSLVFVHAIEDYHLDHVMSSKLGRAAAFAYAAPNICDLPLLPGSAVPHMYYCDAVSGRDLTGGATEPTTIIDVSNQLPRKVQMLEKHASQREWLRAHHGEDQYIAALRRRAAFRGQQISTAAAEAFVQHRGHAFPADDLLAKLLT